jgi:hypothetical protein
MELHTSWIILSKHEEFCGLLKNVKVPSGYSTNISRLISLIDLKVAPGVKSHDYHILFTQMVVVGIWNSEVNIVSSFISTTSRITRRVKDIIVQFKDRHFLLGDDIFIVTFFDLYDLFNLDALDISLMCCFTL